MDTYEQQQQQSSRYMRPPPPPPPTSTADPHHYQQRPPPSPLPPQPSSWYPNQYHYPPPPPSSHSPSPHHWPSPSPPQPPLHSYPPHLPPQNHHFTQPLPPPPPQFPQAYPPPPPPPPLPHVNHEWGNQHWGQQQSWDPVQSNAEDWAAKARAWAAAKAVATEDQHSQSQFALNRVEEQSRLLDQNAQSVNSQYQDDQQPFPAAGYHQLTVSTATSHQQPTVYPQDIASYNPGQSSYGPDAGPALYGVGVETLAGNSATISSVHQQEVPSSYSSASGAEEQYRSFLHPASAPQEVQNHVQSLYPALDRSVLNEQPYPYGNPAGDHTNNYAKHNSHLMSHYAGQYESAGTVPVTPAPANSWPTTAPTGPPPVYPSGAQALSFLDPSISGIPSVSGQHMPFGSFPGANFQPTIPPAGPPHGLSAGPALPPAGFTGDSYMASNVSERPKKAAVPSWLKEEIIKNASVITRSSLQNPDDDTQLNENEGDQKYLGKGDHADSKGVDYSQSTEEEDDDEDDAEAARTAAINLEIKRVLTEVLLKVTDELFDEIATKVLNEDDTAIEDEKVTLPSNDKAISVAPEVTTPKASAKVLKPVKTNESETDAGENSSSGSPGNVLGLANYASDQEDADEIHSGVPTSVNPVLQQSSDLNLSKDTDDTAENGTSRMGNTISDNLMKTSLDDSKVKDDAVHSSEVGTGAKAVEMGVGKALERSKKPEVRNDIEDDLVLRSETHGNDAGKKVLACTDSQYEKSRTKSDENNKDKMRNSGSDLVEEEDSGGKAGRLDDNRKGPDERPSKRERFDDRNGVKEKTKEQGSKARDKATESELTKNSLLNVKEDKKDREKHYSSARGDSSKKRELMKDKEEKKIRHKATSESRRHKRRRSSSIDRRERVHKLKVLSDDDSSDDARRKRHSKGRNSSPSPVKARGRQVSRSPHRKPSHSRHSSYSHKKTRERRSRSKSPAHRRR